MGRIIFETETCSRCSGTGRYSFCQRYADRCFKCAGQKVTLTKRGFVAQKFLHQIMSICAHDVKPGMKMRSDRMTYGGTMFSCIATVTAVEPANSYGNGTEAVCITSEHPKYGKGGYVVPVDAQIKVFGPDHEAKIVAALEYQARLTKAGTIKKRK